ncbi:MAG: response regulator transcription factor [bacterium]
MSPHNAIIKKPAINSVSRRGKVERSEAYRVVVSVPSMVVREGLKQIIRSGSSAPNTVAELSLAELEALADVVPSTIVTPMPEEGASLRRILRLDQKKKIWRWLFVTQRFERRQKWDVLLRRENMSFVDLQASAAEICDALEGRDEKSPGRPLRSVSQRERWPLLSHREWQVFILLGQGQRAQQIGELLGIATPTVRNHLRSLYTKLGVNSRKQAIQHYQSTHE